MRVLIISYFFPPANNFNSLTIYNIAKHLSMRSVDVTVLTIQKAVTDKSLSVSYDGFRVIRVKGRKFFSYGKLLNFISKIFGWGSYISGVRFPDGTEWWVKSAISLVKDSYWDVVISCALPYTSNEIAYYLKKNNKCKLWIIHWADLFSENQVYKGFPFFKDYEKKLEEKFNKSADVILTVSKELEDYFSKQVNSNKVFSLYSRLFCQCELKQFIDKKKNTENVEKKKIKVVFSGAFYPEYNIDYFLEGLYNLKKSNIINSENFEFLLLGHLDIRELFEKYGIVDLYVYKGFSSREEVFNNYWDSDFLFFPLEDRSVSHKWKGVLTGKLFEYMGISLYFKKPAIVVGNSFDVTDYQKIELMKNSKSFIFLKNVNEVESFLSKYVENVYLKNEIFNFDINEDFISYFSCSNQTDRLIKLIEDFL